MADNRLYNILQSTESNFNSISEARAQFPMGDIVQQAATPVYSQNYLADHSNPNYKEGQHNESKKQPKKTELKPNPQTTSTGFGTGNFAGTGWKDKALKNVLEENDTSLPTGPLPDISNLSQLSIQQGPQKVGEQELVPGRANQFGYRATNTITGAGKQIGSNITSFVGTLAKNAGETMSKGTTNNLIWRQNGEGNPNSLNAKMAPSVDKFGSTVQATADELGKAAQADIGQAKNGLSKFGQAGVDIATNVIQMGFDAAVGAVTGGASLASMFVRSAGGAMQKARSEGADTTQQTAYGLATGAIEVITEKLADGVAKIYGGGAADDIAEKLVRKFAKTDTGRTALRALYGMVSEGGEEVISDLLAPYADLLYNDKSFSDTLKNTFKGTYDPSELLYDFVIGFTIGGLGQGASIATGQNAQANAELRAVDTIQNNLAANGMDASNAGRAANILADVAKGDTISRRDSRFLDSVGGYNTAAPQINNPLVQNNAPAQQAETPAPATPSAEAQPVDASAPVPSEPATPARTVETVQAELDPILNEISEIDKAIAENDAAMKQMMAEVENPDDRAIIIGQANQVKQSLEADKAKLQEQADDLKKEQRDIRSTEIQAEKGRLSAGREATGAKKAPNPQPETHIDNRTTESVGKSNVNAFQYDNPEVKPFYKRAAEILMRDLGFMQSSKRSEYGKGTVYGASSKFLERVSSYFGSLNDAIAACEQIIYDKGRENFADPKRIELFLDEMLSNGYEPVDTSLPIIQASSDYLALKGSLQGGTQYDPRARAIQAEMASDFTGSMTEEEAGTIVDRNYAETGFYDPYTRDGQADPSVNEGRQTFEDIDAADTASMEEKYGRGNAAETQNTASEPTTQADTPTEQQSAGTTDSEQFNSKTETTTDTNWQSARPGIPPQRPTGIKTDTSYAELGQQYGTIEQGENPVRDSQTPQRTAPDNKVSESVRTVQEAAATPDTRLQNIQSAVVDGKFSFVPIPNTERAAQAEAKLKKDGWQKMLRDWTSAVRSGQASADLVAQGAVLLNNAANSSECSGSEYIDLMMDYVQLERSTGQALQAARILKTLSPEGKLYGLQKVVQNMNERDNTNSKGNSQNANSDDAISALTESTDGRYSIPESLIDEYRQQTSDEGRDAVIDKMQQAIADQIPSSLGDKFTAIRYLNMLGNFKTQVRNVSGNTGMMLVQKAKNTVRSALETIASVASGGRYQKQYSSLTLFHPSLISAAWNDIQNTSGLKDTAMGEKKYSSASTQFEKGIEEKRNPFKFGDNRVTRFFHIANKQGPAGKLLSLYNKATSWAMEAGDDIFVSMNYTDALAGYLQAHKISADQWTSLVAEADSDPGSTAAKTVDDARAFAIKQAQEATFRDTNRISDFAQNFDRNWGKAKIITQGIAPFRKTPANVGVRMEEYSPLGFVNTAVKAIQAAKGSENVTGADVVDSLSKSLTGTGLAIVGFALAQAGRARTKSDDDKQEAFDKLRGLQDYSITVGDGLNLTLDWAVPASASIFMGVEMFNLVRDGNISPNDAMKVIGNLTAPMLEMSMLSGVNDALNNISNFNEDTDALPQFLLNSAVGYLFQGLTNTLAGQFEQANEEYRQSYYTNPDNKILPTSVQKKFAQAGNKTPGIDWQASDYIDAWGRKQKNEGTTAQRYANALFNPSYTSRLSSKETAVDSELQRLYDYGKDIDGFPSVLPQTAKRNTTVNGTKLSPEEYEEYATTKGQESLRLVSNLIKSDTYKALDDEGKAAAISDCYSYAKYIADSKIAESRGEEYTNGTYTGLMTGVDKSGSAYDKTALNSSNFVEYTAFKIGLDRAVDASDYKAIDKLMNSYGKMNSNLKTVVSERNPVARALSTWKDAGLNSQTYYAVQRELVKSQRKLDKSQKTGSVVELDALANVNMPEAKKKRLIDSLPDYGSKTVKGVYDILYNYGFNSKQINEFWNTSQNWVYKDTGDTQSSQKAGTLQPLEAYYAIEQLPGLDDAQKQDIYNQMREVANVPYKINDWGNYTFLSERSYYESGRSRQEFGSNTRTTQNPLYSSYSNAQAAPAQAAQSDDVLKAILSGK